MGYAAPCRMPLSPDGPKLSARYHTMAGWSWFWTTFGAVIWIVLLGAVVYVAGRLAQHDSRRT